MSQINHPSHYGGENNEYEAIKVIEAWELDFCLGNAVKYISRAGKKDDFVQDLKKAQWYIERKISQFEPVCKNKDISFDSVIEQLDTLIEKCEKKEFNYFERGLHALKNYENAQKTAYIKAKQILVNS
jgi:hypothetical protein